VTAPGVAGSYYDTWKLYTNTGQPVLDQYGMELEFPISVMVVPATAQINGRITIDGSPASAGVNISLEDSYNQTITTLITSPDGIFRSPIFQHRVMGTM
jgi:hypothetical protein